MTFNHCRAGTPSGSGRAGRVVGLVVAAGVLFLTGCTAGNSERDWAAEAEVELAAQGVEPSVVACVVSGGRHELEWGPLTEAALDELLRNCRDADRRTDEAENNEEPVDELAMLDRRWTLGDDPALDVLWADCEAGTGSACDELFEQSPVGSHYESFGLTCGDRPDLLNCAELDEPVEPVEPGQ